MKTNTNMSMPRTILRVMRTMTVDATLGAACGGLYGWVFGGFGAVLHGDLWRVVSTAGYFALCGTVAGALVGACSAIFDSNENTSKPTDSAYDGGEERQASVEAVGHLLASSQRQPQKSVVAPASLDRQRMLPVAARHPLSS